MYDRWHQLDRSHRKLAHRGSRLDLVYVSESTVFRVLGAEGLVLDGKQVREPAVPVALAGLAGDPVPQQPDRVRPSPTPGRPPGLRAPA
jgi:hypothetical protein